MVTPVSILPLTGRPLYTDSPAPHNVSAISPLDPQLFTTIDQHAKDLISGTKNTGYNTSEVISWLEAMGEHVNSRIGCGARRSRQEGKDAGVPPRRGRCPYSQRPGHVLRQYLPRRAVL